MRRRRTVAAIALATALAVSAAAAAKGPESASLNGPGLDQRSLTLVGNGELGSGTALGRLVDGSGFFAQMYGDARVVLLARRPAGALGPRYRVTYVVPGPNGVRSRVVQELYPFAQPGPL